MKKNKVKIIGLVMLAVLTVCCLAGCGEKKEAAKTNEEATGEFSSFSGQDLEGNKIDESLLKKNKVTVLNFWFNDCSACVGEMADLEKFNEKLKEKGAELVGVNVNEGGQKAVDESKNILEKQGATYRNIQIKDGDKAKEYIKNLVAFPTTVVVDKDGNVIGEPICGSLNQEILDDILKRIDDIRN